jgi:hypothetical protein
LLVRLSLTLLALSLCPAPVHADDVRIYHGTVSNVTYAGVADATKSPVYVIVDHTTRELGFVRYYPETRVHLESTFPLTFDAVRPTGDPGPSSQIFLYAGEPVAGSTPVDQHRFRNVGKLATQPISSAATALVAKKLAYSYDFVALAALNAEASAKLKYQRKLTVASNDANLDLAGAIALVLDDLRDRNVID